MSSTESELCKIGKRAYLQTEHRRLEKKGSDWDCSLSVAAVAVAECNPANAKNPVASAVGFADQGMEKYNGVAEAQHRYASLNTSR
jgi:hypothetical protein